MEKSVVEQQRQPPAPTAPSNYQHQRNPSNPDRLSYEIFSFLESKFLFGNDDRPSTTATTTHQTTKNPRGKTCILSVDGGCSFHGAILMGKILAFLEATLRGASGDAEARICDFFDVAAGTGIGGIFVSMLFAAGCPRGSDKKAGGNATPLFQAEETWRFWSEEGAKMRLVQQRRKEERKKGKAKKKAQFIGCCFPSDGGGGEDEVAAATRWMDLTLRKAFGADLTLRDTLKPVLIPCYDMRSSAPFLFSRADALESESFDFRLWEVCRATSAEPGRFEPVQMRSVDGSTRCVAVDGGLAMSNPTAAAITHVLHNKREFPHVRGVQDLLVLSIGFGADRHVEVEFESVRRWREKEWARPIASIAAEGSAELVDHAVAMAFGGSGGYVRVSGSSAAAAVEAKAVEEEEGEVLKQRNVESVLFSGRRIGEQTNAEKIEWLAAEVVAERTRRAEGSGGLTPLVSPRKAR